MYWETDHPVIAGHTGIGLSQRMQSFVLDPRENPYNVVEPGKRLYFGGDPIKSVWLMVSSRSALG